MAKGKRYYWMKLKEGFMTSDTVDYFMSQPEGANYVVLYQMLCLKTINTDGKLLRQIGEVMIPFDVEKIQRDCKWFSADTIRVALKLYKSFGLIYEDVDGVLVLTDHKNLVGSETDWNEQKRNQKISRQKKDAQLLTSNVEKGVENFHQSFHQSVHTENREKSIENRDKSLDNRCEEGEKGEKGAELLSPSLEDVAEYVAMHNLNVDPERFFKYYQRTGWKTTKGNAIDYKEKLREWSKTEKDKPQQQRSSNPFLPLVQNGG